MIKDIQTHAVECYPQESCGLIIDVDGRQRYFACRNKANEPTKGFVIHEEDYVRAEAAGEIVAVVHSHPDSSAQPSDGDRVQCEVWGMPWHILSIGKLQPEGFDFAEVVTIEPCGYVAPLVGRQFAHGILDCYTLVRDFYARELGVELRNYQREDGWWERGGDLYSKAHMEAEGWFEVSEDQLQRGDMIVMQIRSKDVPNHAGVYLGGGLMLHHLYGRLSETVPYGGMWRESTHRFMRYRQ